MRYSMWVAMLPLCAMATSSAGDMIRVADKVYDQVIVREGASCYYVQTPNDGAVFSVPKSEVDAGSVSVTKDPEQRKALVAQWNRHHADPVPETALPANPKRIINPPVADTADTSSPNGFSKGVKLRDSLKAVLRARNLDYTIEDGILVIGSPTLIRGMHRYSGEAQTTRCYALSAMGSETLPKIVLFNPAGNGTVAGTQTGTGMNSGAQFSNISQLFGTIDDRLVGEAPPVLGALGVIGSRR